jgi:hypothetical protein
MKHADLVKIVKSLNKLEFEGIEKIRTVGIKNDELKEKFLFTIEEIDERGMVDKLSDALIDTYNLLAKPEPDEEAEETEEVEETEEEPKEEESEKEKAKKAQKKAAANGRGKNKGEKRSRYGHVQSAISGKLDDLLFGGATVASMMKSLDVPRTRIISHIKSLKNNKGLTVVETKPEGKDVKLNDTHYQVTEEFWTKE